MFLFKHLVGMITTRGRLGFSGMCLLLLLMPAPAMATGYLLLGYGDLDSADGTKAAYKSQQDGPTFGFVFENRFDAHAITWDTLFTRDHPAYSSDDEKDEYPFSPEPVAIVTALGYRYHFPNGLYVGAAPAYVQLTAASSFSLCLLCTPPPVFQDAGTTLALSAGYTHTFRSRFSIGVHLLRTLPLDFEDKIRREDVELRGFYVQSISLMIGRGIR